MIWYLIFQCLATVLFCTMLTLWFKSRKDKTYSFEEWFIPKWKKVVVIWVITMLSSTLLMVKPLWNTTTCQFDSWSMGTETTYSWYKSQCLMKTKNGAWLPMNINRDQPEGEVDNGI